MDKDTQAALALIASLPDQSYFDLDEDTDDRIVEELAELPFHGIVIHAPSQVDLLKRGRLPVFLAAQTTALRNWNVKFTLNTTAVATDLLDGEVVLMHAFASRKRRDYSKMPGSRHGPQPTAEAAAATTSDLRQINLTELMEFDWDVSRYAITFFTHDWVSNTVVSELTGSGGALPPGATPSLSAEAARELGAALRASKADPALLPGFVRTSATPTLPGEGAVLSVPATVSADAPTIAVHGALRLPLAPGAFRVPSADDVEEGAALAYLRASILLVKLDERYRPQADVSVPVVGPVGVKPGDTAEGVFAIDLKAALPGALTPGDYFVYLFAGKHHSGPHALTVTQ